MDFLPSNQHSDIEKMLVNLEKVKVMICFENFSILGQTYYQAEQRFLDVLNEGLVINEQRVTEFLIVSHALLTRLGGEKEQMTGPCFVNKDSILFVGTFGETRFTTSKNINTTKVYPWIEKNVMLLKLSFVDKYKLIGEIHGVPGVLPMHYIKSQKKFLPMTNVKVTSLMEPSEISFDFVAVNRNRVSFFQVS